MKVKISDNYNNPFSTFGVADTGNLGVLVSVSEIFVVFVCACDTWHLCTVAQQMLHLNLSF